MHFIIFIFFFYIRDAPHWEYLAALFRTDEINLHVMLL